MWFSYIFLFLWVVESSWCCKRNAALASCCSTACPSPLCTQSTPFSLREQVCANLGAIYVQINEAKCHWIRRTGVSPCADLAPLQTSDSCSANNSSNTQRQGEIKNRNELDVDLFGLEKQGRIYICILISCNQWNVSWKPEFIHLVKSPLRGKTTRGFSKSSVTRIRDGQSNLSS